MKNPTSRMPEPPAKLPRHWRTLGERVESPEARSAAQDEFVPGALDPRLEPPTQALSRRGFLGLVTGGAATLAALGCDRSAQGTIVPYTRRPAEVVPGVANFYASARQEGRRAYAVLVKTREGRPLHITGNDEHPRARGKTSPRTVAEIMALYDPDRLRGPRADGRDVPWADAEGRLVRALAETKGRPVLLVTPAVVSPSRQALLRDLGRALPGLEHLAFEPARGDGAAEGNREVFGSDVTLQPLPGEAKVILSLASDFLNGEDPAALADYGALRRIQEAREGLNRLWVLEGALSLTGSNADQRFPLRPSQIARTAFALAKDLHVRRGRPLPPGVDLGAVAGGIPPGVPIPPRAWERLLEDLDRAGTGALVLAGDELPAQAHVATHLLNAMLGSRALRIRPAEPLASFRDLDRAVGGMAAGRYAAALFWDVNPAYAFPRPQAFREALAKVPFRAWMGQVPDETAALCHLLLAENHWLESWNDFQDGTHLLLQQPAVSPLYDTRQGEDVLLAALRGLAGTGAGSYLAFLRARWEREVQPAGSLVPFERFFQAALHDGLLVDPARPGTPPSFQGKAVAAAAARAAAGPGEGLDLVLHPGFATLDGRTANNPWLMETPDPVTKMTWENPLLLSVADALRLGIGDGDVVELAAGGTTLRVPAILQPGQAPGVAVLALGYGRAVGRVAAGKGVNGYPLLALDGTPNLRSGAKVARTGETHRLPRTQAHHRVEGEDIVRTLTLEGLAKVHAEAKDPASLYPPQRFPEHKWGMAIDLAACVGCAGCSLACQSENNVPVVGPEQVARGREMHWIRLDTYYEGDPANPSVTHQPMLCQHCDDAPCENVCPVNATNHSPEGLNQMAYNRCVGTRYCANNCPYKVRRFNFLEYTADKHEPETLANNPEVSVRPRGVMEKCTFCVQRIEDGKLRAKTEDRPMRDGDVVPACAAACPTEAIVFGDLLDPASRVARLAQAGRSYRVLEDLGARPAIAYLADLKNPALKGGHHAE